MSTLLPNRFTTFFTFSFLWPYTKKIFRFPFLPLYTTLFSRYLLALTRLELKMLDRKHIENRTKLHWKIVRLSTCQQIIMRKSQATLHKVSLFLLIVKCYKNDRLTVFVYSHYVLREWIGVDGCFVSLSWRKKIMLSYFPCLCLILSKSFNICYVDNKWHLDGMT